MLQYSEKKYVGNNYKKKIKSKYVDECKYTCKGWALNSAPNFSKAVTINSRAIKEAKISLVNFVKNFTNMDPWKAATVNDKINNQIPIQTLHAKKSIFWVSEKSNRAWSKSKTGPVTPVIINGQPASKDQRIPETEETMIVSVIPIRFSVVSPRIPPKAEINELVII